MPKKRCRTSLVTAVQNSFLIVIGYCNEVQCYVPSLRVLREGGYEANEGMIYYGLPGPFDGSVEESVFDAVRAVMQTAGAREWRRSN